MPPEDESPPKENAPKPLAGRTRSIGLMVLAILGLAAVLTFFTESIWRRPEVAPALPSAARPAVSAAIFVAVRSDFLLVDGVQITSAAPYIESKRVEVIEPLKAAMEGRRGASAVGGRVGLLVEKGMPSSVVKSVFLTLRLAGYQDVHFAALPDASSAEGGDD